MAIRNGLYGTTYDDSEPLMCTTTDGQVWNRVTHVRYASYEQLVDHATSVGHSLTSPEVDTPSAAWIAANRVPGMNFGVYTP